MHLPMPCLLFLIGSGAVQLVLLERIYYALSMLTSAMFSLVREARIKHSNLTYKSDSLTVFGTQAEIMFIWISSISVCALQLAC